MVVDKTGLRWLITDNFFAQIAKIEIQSLPYLFYQTLSRNFDPKETMELDRFVHTLNGETVEVIRRSSDEVASTMKKENGMTINRMAQMIQDYQNQGASPLTDTFCGLPHHMLLPRCILELCIYSLQ